MTVAQLLTNVDSYELAEWQAYEHAFGPLGKTYIETTLAEIQEQLQILNVLTGSQYEENPVVEIAKQVHYVRPDEVHNPPVKEEEPQSQYEFDRENFGDG